MPHIHWVARQNKLEIPNDEEEVNTREIHKCDGQAHDPDTMVAPLTPKPTRKAEALAKAPPTIASSREEDAALKEVALPRYRCANGKEMTFSWLFDCLLRIVKARAKDKNYIIFFSLQNLKRTTEEAKTSAHILFNLSRRNGKGRSGAERQGLGHDSKQALIVFIT